MMLSVVWASCTRPNPGRVAGIPSQSPQHLSQVLLRGFRTRTEDLRKGIRRNGPTADEIIPKKKHCCLQSDFTPAWNQFKTLMRDVSRLSFQAFPRFCFAEERTDALCMNKHSRG